MYKWTPNSTKYRIKDQYVVWIPAPASDDLIQNLDLPPEQQIWRRTPLPDFYEDRRFEEIRKQKQEKKLVERGDLKEVRHFDPVLEEFRREQWRRRIYGHYVMINGELIYLTGSWYQYLNWTKLDHTENDGYPFFYMAQRDRFYLRRLCWEDPYSLGYILVGPRGFGKTSEEAAELVHDITMPPHNRKAAIQSKSLDDAKEVVFQEKVVLIFNNYPDFFKPVYSHGSDPKDKMVFKRASKVGADTVNVEFGDKYELGNTINVFSAKEKACDGRGLAHAVQDEVGKTDPKKEADVYVRVKVVEKSVYRNNRKIGLIRATTTVEEMDKGGNECYEIWKESDPLDRDPNGQTASKLYRLFVPATDTLTQFSDKFGIIDEDKARETVLNERVAYEGDPYKLSMITRKTPLTESEAFMTDQTKCMFNVFILTKREGELKALKANQQPYRRGRLEWKNGQDTEVEWYDDDTGHFEMYLPTDSHRELLPDGSSRKILNACVNRWDTALQKKLWTPVNADIFGGGSDPIKYAKTDDPRASKMSGYGFLKVTLADTGKEIDDWLGHNIAWKYHWRSDDPDDDYENIIKAIRYWGHPIMPENNVTTFTKHLFNRGYQKFILTRGNFDFKALKDNKKMTKKRKEEAVTTTEEVINKYIGAIRKFVLRHGHRLNDLELIKQLLEFDPKNPTKYDLVLGFGYALMSLEAVAPENFDEAEEQVMDAFEMWNNDGNASTALSPDEEYYLNQNYGT